jgi:hypothetical protein
LSNWFRVGASRTQWREVESCRTNNQMFYLVTLSFNLSALAVYTTLVFDVPFLQFPAPAAAEIAS